jgi:quercetin dioxygenase-like cupin family protein
MRSSVFLLTFGLSILHNTVMAFADWLEAAVLTGKSAQAGFFEASQTVVVPEHAHAGQWGVVIAGRVDLTIGGVLHVLESGMSYNIPAGVSHSATVHAGAVFIDVWEGKRLEVDG